MKLSLKNYKILKTKTYLKKEKIFFLLNNINRNSTNRVVFEQTLKILCFNYYQIFNKLTNNIFKNSIYNNIYTINGINVIVKPQTKAKKTLLKQQILINNFKLLLCSLLFIKLNNKIYTIKHLKNSNSLNYKENTLALYQFKTVNSKIMFTLNNFFSK